MHFLIEVLLRLFASMVSRGGAPRQETRDGRFGLTYPLRPGMFVYALGSLGCGVYLILVPVQVMDRWQSLLLGVFLVVTASFLLTRTLRLDEEGLSLRSVFTGTQRIGWSEFSHVERYQSTTAGKATWFIRSVPGVGGKDTTITLPEMSYNTDDLLGKLRERVALPEWPRKKRHWWGG